MGKAKKESTAMSVASRKTSTLYTRSLLLRGVAGVYLCAFLTFYYQSSGLFGRNGILPAHSLYDNSRSVHLGNNTPAPIHSYLGLDIHYMLEFVSLLGGLLSFLVFISNKLCVAPVFMALWAMYYHLMSHMQIFENQSDNLLLEVGAACVILAACKTKSSGSEGASDVAIILLKWILMRFLFDSGSVKLFSGCPHWSSFQGLKYHFLTMPLPTSLAWWSHHLPTDFMTATNIYTNLTELICPWLFFFPHRLVRIFMFHWVFYLQLSILCTGNYGFLNLLISVLLLTLLDDAYFKKRSLIRFFVEMVIFSVVLLATLYVAGGILHGKHVLFKQEYLNALRTMARIAPVVAVIASVWAFLTNISSRWNFDSSGGFLKKFWNLSGLITCTLITLFLIGISTVPHFNVDASLNITNTQLGKYYKTVNKFHIVNEYGRHLRRIRTERLEIVLEHSEHLEGPFKPIPFEFKPWTENNTLPYAGPYLPRLDMKFYDAAPTPYQDHLWMMALAYRILQNEPEVLRLFGLTQTFDSAPKFVRARLFKFVYTPFQLQPRAIWRKVAVGEHFPPVSLSDTILITHLRKLHYPIETDKTKITNPALKEILDFLRIKLEMFQASKAIMLISFTGLVINLIHG